MARLLFCTLTLLVPLNSVAQSDDGEKASKELTKVILVGDSIRMSYAPVVAKQLEGTAVVISSKSNGGDSGNVLKNLDAWVIREKPAVVHFNCGIHDTKKFIATGKFQISPTKYEANLRSIVARIRTETDAVVVFGTTTPILDDRAAVIRKGRNYELLGASVEQYNAIARKVMQELKVPINDLNKALIRPAAPLTTDKLIGSDGVHLTPAARELLGKQVAMFVSQQLTRRDN
jgi:lysophospholipase L1-like esterase